MESGHKVRAYLLAGAIGLFAFPATGGMVQASSNTGETEFKEYCAACHFDGGNLINPAKTLSRTDREKHGITSDRDIIQVMRKPGEGMSIFDEKTLPETEAKKIAEYIINTFK